MAKRKRKRSPHERIIEMFKGRHNILTVLLIIVGSLFVAKSVWEIVVRRYGDGWTIIIGLVLMIVGYYVSDEMHQRYGGNDLQV